MQFFTACCSNRKPWTFRSSRGAGIQIFGFATFKQYAVDMSVMNLIALCRVHAPCRYGFPAVRVQDKGNKIFLKTVLH